jgi:hypothetical protein
VRGDQRARLVPQGVAVRQRLGVGDVERRAADGASRERGDQRVGVDQRAARDVHEPRVIAHRRQLVDADQMAGGAGGRRREHDMVRARPHLVEAVGRDRAVAASPRDREDLHAQRLEHLDQRASDAAGAHYRHRRAVERRQRGAPPRGGARAVREPPGTRQHQHQRVLRHRAPVGACGRGPDPLVVDPLEPPLDAGRRQLDPAHLVRELPGERF